MGSSTITTVPGSLPFNFDEIIVDVKSDWAASYVQVFDLILLDFDIAVSEAGMDRAVFYTRYGAVMQPGETDFAGVGPAAYQDYWVRISYPDDSGTPTVLFVGQFISDGRHPQGTSAFIAGQQDWIAYGAKEVLKLIDVYKSDWVVFGDVVELGWIPPMNARDPKTRMLVGNRSDDPIDDTYYYGGKSVWSHAEYINYFLDTFVNGSGRPLFSLAGQWTVLEFIETTIDFGAVQNADDLLRKLIPKKECGLDYVLIPTSDGFEINVFTLLTSAVTFGSVTVPANANTVTIERGSQLDMVSIAITQCRDNLTDKIRIIGKRAVICHSLYGSAPNSDLVARWSSTLEDAYKDADGKVSGGEQDIEKIERARSQDKFKSVYADIGAPTNWDMRGGLLAPDIGLDGTLTGDNTLFQVAVRHTLSWTPLFHNRDYTVDPATPSLDSFDVPPELRSPFAFIHNTEDAEQLPSSVGYVQCEHFGIGVSGLQRDWGIRLHASPNYKLAFNDWSDTDVANSDKDAEYDWASTVATIARELDFPLAFGVDIDPAFAKGDGSQQVHHVGDAELWLLAPETVVDLDEDGGLLSSPNYFIVLRNDVDRLALMAAGLVGRYLEERMRVTADFKGWRAWPDFLGQMVIGVEEASGYTSVGAPITKMSFKTGVSREPHTDGKVPVPSPSMQIFAGYSS